MGDKRQEQKNEHNLFFTEAAFAGLGELTHALYGAACCRPSTIMETIVPTEADGVQP